MNRFQCHLTERREGSGGRCDRARRKVPQSQASSIPQLARDRIWFLLFQKWQSLGKQQEQISFLRALAEVVLSPWQSAALGSSWIARTSGQLCLKSQLMSNHWCPTKATVNLLCLKRQYRISPWNTEEGSRAVQNGRHLTEARQKSLLADRAALSQKWAWSLVSMVLDLLFLQPPKRYETYQFPIVHSN